MNVLKLRQRLIKAHVQTLQNLHIICVNITTDNKLDLLNDFVVYSIYFIVIAFVLQFSSHYSCNSHHCLCLAI